MTSYLCSGPPCGLFISGFLANSLCACLFCHAQYKPLRLQPAWLDHSMNTYCGLSHISLLCISIIQYNFIIYHSISVCTIFSNTLNRFLSFFFTVKVQFIMEWQAKIYCSIIPYMCCLYYLGIINKFVLYLFFHAIWVCGVFHILKFSITMWWVI